MLRSPPCLLVSAVGCQGVEKSSPEETANLGGAWARWGAGVCPRTPGLTSVLDSGWLPVGYMMCDGVFRQMCCGRSVFLGRLP